MCHQNSPKLFVIYVYAVFFQGLFRNFDDTFLDLIKPHLGRLCIDPQVRYTAYQIEANIKRVVVK